MKSVYVFGPAGVGKSTFMGGMLRELGPLGPLHLVHSIPRKDGGREPLSGHTFPGGGLYLGRMREKFPGTDGLSRSCGPAAVDWIRKKRPLPAMLLSEGLNLATRVFLGELSEESELVAVYLTAPWGVLMERAESRGLRQSESFVRNTITRSRNLAEHLRQVTTVLEASSGEEKLALERSLRFLRN